MVAKPLSDYVPVDAHRKLFHAINNRMNTIALGLRILEQDNDLNSVHTVANSLQEEFRDLQHLIAELRHTPPD